jgi:lipopolysaccharide/colanic/teichoic acid biosynthesis glycosyltransferase
LEVILNNINKDNFLPSGQPEPVDDSSILRVIHHRLENPLNRNLKRAIDLVLSSLSALILFPLVFPLTALLIKLSSKGPVFFLQKRTGLNGKTFTCIKFRTMVVNKDADRLEVQAGDKRITRVGRFLRKYYIDEFPQLINVVRGEMSLVGPRPLMLRHTVLYSRIIKNYPERHKVKPGLTGLAQMRGYHGIIATKRDLFLRTASDIEYITNWTVKGDLYIFFATFLQIFKKK